MNNEDNWFVKNNLTPPTHTSHGITPDEISQNVKSVNPRNWRAEGNRLIADTDMGPLVQLVPTSHIFTGVDKQGLPKFRRVV